MRSRPADRRRHEPPRQKTLVERLLSPIADVRQEEAASALLMTLLMFLILGAYYLLKTAREVFILSEGGAEVKSYSSAGQALLLLVLVPAYGAFASSVNRERLVHVGHAVLRRRNVAAVRSPPTAPGCTSASCTSCGSGIFNVMVIAQFWAFANDLFTPEQGKRLFPLIGVGQQPRARGSVRCGPGSSSRRAGPLRLLARRAASSSSCARCSRASSSRVGDARRSPQTAGRRGRSRSARTGGFELIRKDRYLMLIAALDRAAERRQHVGRVPVRALRRRAGERASTAPAPATAAAREQFIGETYSHLFSTVNLLGFLLQMFVVSRVFKFLGVARVAVHPPDRGAGRLPAACCARRRSQLMGWLKIADNSLDYSLGNTTKQALWLPTSREAKYKAKQAVDSFFVRAGDVIQAGVVFVGRAARVRGPRLRRRQRRPRRRLARRGGTAQPDAAPQGPEARTAEL